VQRAFFFLQVLMPTKGDRAGNVRGKRRGCRSPRCG
jgi:hypothetical protein